MLAQRKIIVYSAVGLLLWIIIVCTGFKEEVRYRGLLKYSELKKLGVACSPKDTCLIPRRFEQDNLWNSRCQCRESCAKFNTCCIDSPYARFMPAYWNKQRGICQQVYFGSDTVLMVSECLPGWNASAEIRSMCEEPVPDLKDPIGQAPVTNLQSEVTYKNYFCAHCNNDADFLEFWGLKISKTVGIADGKLDNNNILRQMMLNEYDQWVVQVQNDENKMVEEPVFIEFTMPARGSNMIIPCMMNVISECAEGWRDDTVRSMCRAYMGIVYLNSNESGFNQLIAYRNIHCGICNYVPYSPDKVCETVVFTPYSVGVKPPFSFTLLLDVNLADGDKVGEINRCGNGKMYDPFFKKCRTLVCGLPGYVMQRKECVKI